jgi:endonuclease/exonuclease/phosphatase family metal-dependent hydrolase
MEKQRLHCLLDQIQKEQYDVVAFQELSERQWYGKSSRRYVEFVESLHGLGYTHHVAGPAPQLKAPFDGGTAIFSRHAVVASSTHPWQKQVSWDSFASKGVVQALLEVAPPVEVVEAAEARAVERPGFVPMLPRPARLHVVTLHAQASHAGWQNTAGEDRYRSTRLEQMQQLAHVLREEAKDGEAVLAFGDFNFDARDLDELTLHQSRLALGTGRSKPPVDVLATTFGGDHPATFGLRDDFGRPLETFLTTRSLSATEQCLDHVYFWPAEPGAYGYPHQPEGPLGLEKVNPHGFVHGEPRCRLEICPYTGPASTTGERPTQVSDHFGWSVEFDLAWHLRWSLSPTIGRSDECAPSFPVAKAPMPREKWLPDDWLREGDSLPYLG